MAKGSGSENIKVLDIVDIFSKLAVPVLIAIFGWIIATAQFNGQREAEALRAQQSTLQAYFDGIQTRLHVIPMYDTLVTNTGRSALDRPQGREQR
jgi:hypothetical protein